MSIKIWRDSKKLNKYWVNFADENMLFNLWGKDLQRRFDGLENPHHYKAIPKWTILPE